MLMNKFVLDYYSDILNYMKIQVYRPNNVLVQLLFYIRSVTYCL